MTNPVKTHPVEPVDNITAYAVELSNVHVRSLAMLAEELRGSLVRHRVHSGDRYLSYAAREADSLRRRAEDFADRARALSEAISEARDGSVSRDEEKMCPLTFSSGSPESCREDCALYETCSKLTKRWN